MKKQPIKVIKRSDAPKPVVAKPEKPERKRSVESTIQGWITERRDNEETEDRSRNSQLDDWSSTSVPA